LFFINCFYKTVSTAALLALTNQMETNHMTLIANYPSKKSLKANVGGTLNYIETSIFGPQYRGDGTLTVCNRPHITGVGREWFGRVTMQDHKILRVE